MLSALQKNDASQHNFNGEPAASRHPSSRSDRGRWLVYRILSFVPAIDANFPVRGTLSIVRRKIRANALLLSHGHPKGSLENNRVLHQHSRFLRRFFRKDSKPIFN